MLCIHLGIRTLIDVCIENWTWNSFETTFGVINQPPKRLCLHQSAGADFLDFPCIRAEGVKQISLSYYMNITEYNIDDIIQFDFKNLTDFNFIFPVPRYFPIEKLILCLKTFPMLQKLRLDLLLEGDLSKLVKEVPTFSNLTYLDVGLVQWDKNDIDSISVCKKVIHLSLSSLHPIQNFVSFQSKLQNLLFKLPELRQLELQFSPDFRQNSENNELTVNNIVSLVNKLPKLTALKVGFYGGKFFSEWQNKWQEVMNNNLKLFVAFRTLLPDGEEDPIDIKVNSSERFTVFLKDDGGAYPTRMVVVAREYSQPLDSLQDWKKMELKQN